MPHSPARFGIFFALLAGGCSIQPLGMAGYACEADGACTDGYTCDEGSNTCITVGDGCEPEGATSPCTFGAVDCDAGCRTCIDGTWSDCQVPDCTPVNGGVEIACNDIDEDCNGRDLLESGTIDNCAQCGDYCLAGSHVVVVVCATSGAAPECQVTGCDPSWMDLDGDAGNGCEAQCSTTNGGVEICDGLDNDCDGVPDNVFDLDSDCDGRFADANVASWACIAGACAADTCALGYWDIDGLGMTGCEYACTTSNAGTETCDGIDNDCDGINDDIADANVDCGAQFPGAADVTGWACLVGGCDIVGCTPGLADGDNDPATGCEITCVETNGGAEICDGFDNDCDGTTDNGFAVGGACGVGACTGGQLECLADGSGTQCSTESGGSDDRESADICDYVDNDCDGTVDNGFNVGAACGADSCAGGSYECTADGSGTRCSNDGLPCGDGICNECLDGVCSESAVGAPGPACTDATVGECSGADTCEAGGACSANDVAEGTACGDGVCNECGSGICVETAVGAAGPGCSDPTSNDCSAPDTCEAGGVCNRNDTPDGAACGDGICNECAAGACEESAAGGAGPGCADTANNGCTTADTCEAGGVCNEHNQADGTACGDNVCNQCTAGVCTDSPVGAPGPGCSNSTTSDCTAPDTCEIGGVCSANHTANGTACGDMVCNACSNGNCVDWALGIAGPGCDDTTNDGCTAPDICMGGGVCNRQHRADGTACGDLVCNECGGGVCVASAIGAPGPGCTSITNDTCTAPDACDAGGVCNRNHAANGTACGDGVCNECGDGACVDSTVGVAGPGCDDATSDSCTQPDICAAGGICDPQHQTDGTACGDGVCDECSGGACGYSPGGVPGPGCTSSATACTGVELCDGGGACNAVDPPDGSPCDADNDLNACDDSCQGGACVAGNSADAGLPCGNSATTACTNPDTCDGSGSCQPNHVGDGTACGDGVCNECGGGVCVDSPVGAAGPSCDDATNDDCTAPDTCLAGGICGVNHSPNATPCGDGVCNECNAGICAESAIGIQGPGCTSTKNDNCTSPDRCAAGGVCDANHAPDGTACWDMVCNECTAGACGSSPVGQPGPGCTGAINDDCTAPDTCGPGGVCNLNDAANGTACGDMVCNQCAAGGCVESASGAPGPGCNDPTNNTCTDPDTCEAGGLCNQRHEADSTACGDLVCNECGSGVCVASAVGSPGPGCNDATNDTCTGPDTCAAGGVCAANHAPDSTPCGDLVCNECSTGLCVDSALGSPGPGCNDTGSTICTSPDTCGAGGICNPNHAIDGTACGDLICNECGSGVCVASTIGVPGPGCDDAINDACTAPDVCAVGGACNRGHAADGTACGDMVCNECGTGICVDSASGSPGPGCDDATNNTCTAADICGGGGTCNRNHAADGTACGDLICNQCGSGICVDSPLGVPGPGCSDLASNDCTAPDTCDVGGVCDRQNQADGTACGDMVCNECSIGACIDSAIGAPGPGCSDLTSNDCTAPDLCAAAGVCDRQNQIDGTGCGDGVCNECNAGACTDSPAGVQGPGCAAGASTCSGVETCDGSGGCQSANPPDGTPCDADSDLNTCDDSCQLGVCVNGTPATVDLPCGSSASTICTDPDTCNGAGACLPNNIADGTPCGDFICNECTTGVCVETTAGSPGPGCDDATDDDCTQPDTCAAGGLCSVNHAADTTPCNDGICNECNAGACVDSAAGQPGPGCDDTTNDGCTTPDTCAVGGACNANHAPDGTACWDMVCNQCTTGACGDSPVGLPGPGCSDATSNTCTAPDTCAVGGICLANHAPDATPCGDMVCDECGAGACVNSPVGSPGPGCDDIANNTCTAPDSCVAGGICNPNHAVDGIACGDLVCNECGAGLCVDSTAGAPGPGCSDATSDICTAPDTCGAGGACNGNHTPDGTACGDLVCNECGSGVCVTSTVGTAGPGCDDPTDDTCTAPDTCAAGGLCNANHAADGTVCGDLVCNECGAGICVDSAVGNPGPGCSDVTNDDCTAPDTCDVAGVCNQNHAANGVACGDMVCNECGAGMCVNSTIGISGPGCTDLTTDLCTSPDTCDAGGVCNPNHTANGTACGDLVCNECNTGTCVNSSGGVQGPGCAAGATTCSGVETCDGGGGCQSADPPDGTPCDADSDTNVCDDSCQAGACVADFSATINMPCGDSSSTTCTNPDTCDGAGSCQGNHAADGTACGDMICNECATGACADTTVGSIGPGCNDGTSDLCTAPDTCAAGGVCDANHSPNGTACGDLECNECNSGSCVSSAAGVPGPGCDDTKNDDCTDPDVCLAGGVCNPKDAADGTACWDMICNQCAAGACGESPNGLAGPGCNDATNNACTVPDTCGAGGLCNPNHAPDATPCGDLVCNQCAIGTCVSSPVGVSGPGCDDSTDDTCTTPDTCAAAGACSPNHALNGTACGDGVCNECGTGVCIETGAGSPGPGCDNPDNNNCTAADTCELGGVCDEHHQGDGTACGDLVCNECDAGTCIASAVGVSGPNCDDGTDDECTDPDTCEAGGNCNPNHEVDGTACGDGVCNECGTGACVDSAVGGTGPGCDDLTNDACTAADTCELGGVCDEHHEVDGTACGGGVCEECIGGACFDSPAGVPGPGCDDATNDDCTAPDTCELLHVCDEHHQGDGTACGDGVCNECTTGVCVDSALGLACGDASDTDCTDPDTCDEAGACSDNHEADGTACGDLICNECNVGLCVDSALGLPCGDPANTDCTDPDTCDGGGACLDNHAVADVPCQGANLWRCDSTCNGSGSCVDGAPVDCDDGCDCSADTCLEPAGNCQNDFSGCGITVTGPGSAVTKVTFATLTIDTGCAGESANIVCTTSSAQVCFYGPQLFESNMGGFTLVAGQVWNGNCGVDDNGEIPSNGGVLCSDDDAAGADMLIIERNNTAVLDLVDATGFTNIQVNYKAGISFQTEPATNEHISTRACCNTAPACVTEIGRALNLDDGGSDAWAWRGPFSPSPANGLDNCANIRVNFDWRASAADEMAHVDNFCISGIGTLTLPLTDNGDGTYTTRFSAAANTNVTVTCDWTNPDGLVSDTAVVDFD